MKPGASISFDCDDVDNIIDPVDGVRKLVLMVSLFVIFFVFACQYAAIARIFLPGQVADLDPANKVANLGAIGAVTSLGIAAATLLSGALSDRLRSRWGRRTPFVVVGASVGCLMTFSMSQASNLWTLGAFWVVGTFFLNSMDGPLTTLIADRFRKNARGIASGCVGAGITSGLTVGTILAGNLGNDLTTGYSSFAIALMLATAGFVVLNREPSTLAMPSIPLTLRDFLRSFWIDPRIYPDFALVFCARFLMFIGYTSVVVFTLYSLTDYIGLSAEEARHEMATIFLIQLVGNVVFGLGAGYFSDKINRRKPFVITASLLVSIAFLIPVFQPTLEGMYWFAAFMGAGFGAYTAVDTALMTDVLPKASGASSGKDLSILQIAITVPQILGSVLAVTILAMFDQDYRSLFLAGTIFVIASSLLIVPIRSTR
jgi:MFS family permease